jgi:hypothetical protein
MLKTLRNMKVRIHRQNLPDIFRQFSPSLPLDVLDVREVWQTNQE